MCRNERARPGRAQGFTHVLQPWQQHGRPSAVAARPRHGLGPGLLGRNGGPTALVGVWSGGQELAWTSWETSPSWPRRTGWQNQRLPSWAWDNVRGSW